MTLPHILTLVFVAAMVLINGALGLYYVEKTQDARTHALLGIGHLLLCLLFTVLWVWMNQ